MPVVSKAEMAVLKALIKTPLPPTHLDAQTVAQLLSLSAKGFAKLKSGHWKVTASGRTAVEKQSFFARWFRR